MDQALRELLDAAAQDDAQARDRLLRELYPGVRDLVHRSLDRDFRRRHPWMLAMFSTGDIVQEVFLAVVKSRPEVGAGDERQLRGWFAVQVENRIVDRVRFHLAQRRNVRQVTPLQHSDESIAVAGRDPSPSVLAVLDERAGLLQRALAALEPLDGELWRRRVDEEQSFAEIAAALQLASDEAARSAFRRVQARLALRLQKLGLHSEEAAPS